MHEGSMSGKPKKETTSVRLDPDLRKRADEASGVLGVIALGEYLDRVDEAQKQKERDDWLREVVPALKAIADAVQALLNQEPRSPEPPSTKE